MTKPYTNYDRAFEQIASALEAIEIQPALLKHEQVVKIKMTVSDMLDQMERNEALALLKHKHKEKEPETFPNEYNWSGVV